MNASSEWTDDFPVLGEMPLRDAVAKLREIGEDEAADALSAVEEPEKEKFSYSWWPFRNRAWQHTAHALGHLPAHGKGDLLPIREAGAAEADQSLRNSRINVILIRLYAADYPGGGMHRVLIDLAVRSRSLKLSRPLHFAARYDVKDGETAGVVGYPIFLGLPVGAEGIVVGGVTVNVGSEADEKVMGALDGDSFRNGLKLLNSWQPALSPLSELMVATTKAVASRSKNVAVQKFNLGLGFEPLAGAAHLAEGSYVVAQVAEELELWDWEHWAFDVNRGRVINTANPKQPVPFNYVVIGISRYGDI